MSRPFLNPPSQIFFAEDLNWLTFGPKYVLSPNVITSIGPKDEAVISEILSAAKILFEKFGLKKTTMEEIAVAAGKGKSSLYYYYASKFEIFEAVVEREMQAYLKTVYKAVDRGETARDQLKSYLTVQLCKIAKQGNLSQALRNDIMDNLEVITRIKKKHEINQVTLVRDIITGGVKSGEFKKIKVEEINLLAYLFVGSFNGISLPMCVEHHIVDANTRIDTIIDVLIDGIGK